MESKQRPKAVIRWLEVMSAAAVWFLLDSVAEQVAAFNDSNQKGSGSGGVKTACLRLTRKGSTAARGRIECL